MGYVTKNSYKNDRFKDTEKVLPPPPLLSLLLSLSPPSSSPSLPTRSSLLYPLLNNHVAGWGCGKSGCKFKREEVFAVRRV